MPCRRRSAGSAVLACLVALLLSTGGASGTAQAEEVHVPTSQVESTDTSRVLGTGLRPHETTPLDRARSALGLAAIVGVCVLLSRDRRRIDWRLVGIGLGLQAVLAIALLLRIEQGEAATGGVFGALNDGVGALLGFGEVGAAFLFRSYATRDWDPALRNFAFSVLPSIVFFSALMAVLYHLGLMQVVIRGLSWVLQRTMRTSGAETLSTAANIFVGQTEAPLLVRPFIGALTRSELLVVMAGGMANTAGGVLAAYVSMLRDHFPDIAGHLVTESILSAPAALVTAKLILPEDGTPVTSGVTRIEIPRVDRNGIEAAARGASEGLSLAFNVAAMLIAFIALVTMADALLAWVSGAAASLLHGLTSGALGSAAWSLTFQELAGWFFAPVAWILGVPWDDCAFAGRLLGQKLIVNEFVAYGTLSEALAANPGALSERGMLIVSYALSGFANFGSIGILIGGMGALAPERRGDIAALGLWAVVAGSLATFMTACFAGLLR